MTIINTTIQDYRERMRKELEETPQGLFMTMIRQSEPITDEQREKARKFEEEGDKREYQHREKIPEPLLIYADLYHELTGQEPTKRSFTDWIDTLWIWKDEQLQPDHIRMAWEQAQSDKGFTVGRPGALTITAIGMKSKAKPAMLVLNTERIEQTKAVIEQRAAAESTFVPRPEYIPRPHIARTGQKG